MGKSGANGHLTRDCGHGAHLVVNAVGDVYRDVSAVTLGPPFFPKVACHFGNFLNLGAKRGAVIKY